MAKRESIVPGLGKQQAKVFNNEEGRRAEHKRHLEELGFPKEVDAAFMRYAPVSYDDETPYPSKVVNQAGEDLGFTPKDSLMKSDIQSIVKEAVQEVFVQKDWLDDFYKRSAAPQGAVAKKSGGKLLGKLAAGFIPFLSRATVPGTIGYYSSPTGQKELEGFAEGAIDFFAGLFDPNYGKALTEKDINNRMDSVAIQFAIKGAGDSWKTMSQAQQNEAIDDIKNSDAYKNAYKDLTKDLDATSGVLNQSPMNLDKKTIQEDITQQLTVDAKATDPAGVPLEFQPGGRPDAGKTYEAGKGQTADQSGGSTSPIAYDPKKETDAIGMPRQFEPGASGPTRRGEVQFYKPGKGETLNQPKPPQPQIDPSKFGQIGPRQIKDIRDVGGTLYGTVSGSGTNDYSIEIKPETYAGIKVGDTIDYNPSQDEKGYSITTADGKTSTGTRPGLTMAEAQRKIAQANPAAQPKDSPYLKNMQKQDGFDYGGFAPGTSRRRGKGYGSPNIGSARDEDAPRRRSQTPKRDRPSYTPDRMPLVGEGKSIEGFNYDTVRPKRGGQKPEARNLLLRPDDPKGEAIPLPRRPDDKAEPVPADNPKGRYDSRKQRDLQRMPAPPTLKNMQKYQAWIEKAEDEGAMAKVQLDRVSDLADMMHDILEDEDQLPGWIQNKIADSLHNLEASITHVMYDEKEDRDLVKSKEVFQDFLVRAPQGGGTLLNDDIYLQKGPFAFLRALPATAKFIGKLFGKKNAKDITKKSLEDTAKKGLTRSQKVVLTGGAGAVLYGIQSGNIKVGATEEKSVSDELGSLAEDLQEKFNNQLSGIGQGLEDQFGALSDKYKEFKPPEIQQPPQPSPSNQQIGEIGDGLTDRELGRRGASITKPSYTEPIYDTSPEAEARVRAGGSESIIGANVDGQKYKFKQPVSNMGQVNQALQRATPVREIVKEAIVEISKAKKKGGRKKDPRLARAGVDGFNKPKRTPKHPKKSHIVVAKEGNKIKTIRYGEQGAKTAGDPKKGESAKMKKKRKSFKARHGKNIKRGKMSAAYWADKSKW